MKDFPTNTIKRLAKEVGIERISENAIKELKIIILSLAEKYGKIVVENAKHAKRKTLKLEDVLLMEESLK